MMYFNTVSSLIKKNGFLKIIEKITDKMGLTIFFGFTI